MTVVGIPQCKSGGGRITGKGGASRDRWRQCTKCGTKALGVNNNAYIGTILKQRATELDVFPYIKYIPCSPE